MVLKNLNHLDRHVYRGDETIAKMFRIRSFCSKFSFLSRHEQRSNLGRATPRCRIDLQGSRFEFEPCGLGPKPTTRVTRYFKINLTSAPLITFLGPANFITVSLPILFSPVLPSISPRVTKFPPLQPRTFRLHKLTRSADYGLARLLATSPSSLKAA